MNWLTTSTSAPSVGGRAVHHAGVVVEHAQVPDLVGELARRRPRRRRGSPRPARTARARSRPTVLAGDRAPRGRRHPLHDTRPAASVAPTIGHALPRYRRVTAPDSAARAYVRPAGRCTADAPLRIAYLTYRGKPHVGGQGVYTRHLTKALVDLGHHVEVLGGQPYPVLDERVPLHRAAQPRHLQRPLPGPVPGVLGDQDARGPPRGGPVLRRARSPSRWRSASGRCAHLKPRAGDFDLVHDNQCLGYGILAHREADPDDRHAAPPDHQGPRARDGPRAELAQAAGRRALVLVREDAGPRRVAACRASSSSARTRSTTSTPTWASPRPHAAGAGRRRPRAVPAAAGRRPRARPADHHRVGRRRAEGSVVPARGGGEAAHRARRHADDHRQAEGRAEHGPDRRARPASRVEFVVGRDRRAHRRAVRRGRAGGRAEPVRGLQPARRSRRWRPARPRGHRRRRAARGHRHGRRDRAAVPGRRRRRAGRDHPPRPRRRRAAGPGRRGRPAPRGRALDLAALRRAHRRAVPRGAGDAGQRRQAPPERPPG